MSSVDAWLRERRPRPPDVLAASLEGPDVPGAERHQVLAERAVRALDRARAAPGPVRPSAFDLLAADALLTYACEAALETSEPSGALAWIFERAAAARA